MSRKFLAMRGDCGAVGERKLAGDEIDGLDAVGAFIDRRDPRVAEELRRAGFLDIAHAAMHLDAERGDFVGDVGGERFGDRREQRSLLMRLLARPLSSALRSARSSAIAVE